MHLILKSAVSLRFFYYFYITYLSKQYWSQIMCVEKYELILKKYFSFSII